MVGFLPFAQHPLLVFQLLPFVALFREHRASSELWAKMVSLFGRQRTIQFMMIMGEYFKAGFMMNAVDQHLPPDREALLPPLQR